MKFALRRLSMALSLSGLAIGVGHAPLALALEPSSSVEYRYNGGGEDGFSGAALDPAGNLFIVAASGNNAAESVPFGHLIAKYDADGQLLWQRRHFTGAASWYGQGMAVAADGLGNAYVVLTESYFYGRVLKYDANGNETMLFPGEGIPYNWDHGINLKTDAANNLYVYGTGYLEKYAPSGQRLWRVAFSNTWAAPTRDVEIDANGNIYVLGQRDASGSQNIVLAKYGADGRLQWNAIRPVAGGTPGGLEFDDAGNPVIAFSEVVDGAVNTLTLVRYGTDGMLRQSRSMRFGNLNGSPRLARSIDGHFVVGTSVFSANNTWDLLVTRADAAFNPLWQRVLNYGWNDQLNDLAVDDQGGITIAANTDTGSHWSNAAFRAIKLSANGETQWSVSEGAGIASWAKVDGEGGVYVGGITRWPHDALVVRYDEARNAAPVANAGGDRVLECQGAATPVTLDGRASHDPDGDPLSFLWQGPSGIVPGPLFNTALALGTYSFTLTVSDGKGLSASDTAGVEVKDTLPPVVEAGPSVALIAEGPQGATFQPTYTAADACGTAQVTVSPASTLFAVGQTQVVMSATDDSGNQSRDSMIVSVGYEFGGFLPPLKENGLYKLGRTLPVKFQLSYRDAALVTTAAPTLQVLPIGDNGVSGDPIDPQTNVEADTGFRYSDGYYVYNLSTANLAAGTYRLLVSLGDGTAPRSIDVSFK